MRSLFSTAGGCRPCPPSVLCRTARPFRYHGASSKDCQHVLLKLEGVSSGLELLGSSQGSVLLQTAYPTLGSNLTLPPQINPSG